MESEKNARTWLILAHCFNMDGRAASQTITDRIPFLMEKGIVPVVLSAPHGKKDARFPHYRIISPAPSGFLFEMRHIIKDNVKNGFVKNFFKSMLAISCLPFLIIEKLFIHLDSHWSWFISASIKGSFLVKKYRPELIYSTAGPPSTHLAGLILKKTYKIPWLAEIHDPLIYDQEKRKWQFYFFKKWLEKGIFRNSSAVIYFSEVALRSAVRRNPAMGNGYVLRPGADPPDITGVQYKKRNKIHFGHFGSLAEERNLKVFIQAVYELLKDRPEWRERICLDVYGSELDPVSLKTLSAHPLKEVLARHGRLEYDPQTNKSGRQQVMEAMRQSDVLLLIHGEGVMCDEYIPSKFYEYLLTHRPILGLVKPGSELEAFLIETGNLVAAGNDIKAVKDSIDQLTLKWESGGLVDLTDKSPFTVESAVKKLLNIVEGLN
jgi:glycosyltransferase involved in cell wall biosynthesis